MSWSWKLGRIAGIDVRVHWTFLLLLGWIILATLGGGATLGQTLGAILFVLAIFACVVLHEYGHAMVARRYGVPTRDITLLPIGGVARLQRMPEQPMQEFWVAVAGPAVNLAIAAVLLIVLLVLGRVEAVTEAAVLGGGFVAGLLQVNLLIVAFNLLPAFPMDGGRVLRALLARKIEYLRATRIAAGIGQAMAIAFGIAGLIWFNPLLLLIALFVYLGAEAEARMVEVRSAVRDLHVDDAMMTRFTTLAPFDTLQRAADELLAGSQQDFPIVENGSVLGVLRRDDLVKGLKERGGEAPVLDVMHEEICAAISAEELQPALDRMQREESPVMLVMTEGRLAGMLTLENVGELVMLRRALQAGGSPALPRQAAAA